MKTITFGLKQWSLKTHLIVGVTSVHALLMVVFIFDTYIRQSNYIDKNLKEQTENLAHTLTYSSINSVLSKDLQGLSEIIKSQAGLNNLEQILIADINGKILAHSNTSLVGKYLTDIYSQQMLSGGKASKYTLFENLHMIDVAAPVIFQNKTHAWVRVRMNKNTTNQALEQLLIDGIIYSFFAVLIGWIVSSIIAKILSKQIIDLANVADQFKKGNRAIRAKSFDTFEVSQLSLFFNEMMETLNKEDQALKSSQKLLKESEERFYLAMEGSNEGLWDWNIETNEVFFSVRWKKMLGYEDHELKNTLEEWKSLVHPDDLEKVLSDVAIHFKEVNNKYENIHRLKHKQGHCIYILDKGQCIRDTHGKVYRMIGTHNDISDSIKSQKEKEDLQARLVETAKMAALGEMSSGIAHEINNPLTIILGKVDYMTMQIEKKLESQEVFIKDLEVIKRTAHRISKIIKGLRTFARNAEHDPFINTSLKSIIDETLDLCRQKFNSAGVEIKLNVSDYTISCRAVEISQVFMNLLSNSYDAIAGLEQKWVQIETQLIDKKIHIIFTDSGSGIEDKILEKIFHPFYTTKDVGHGTGLGLSISQGIMNSHKGNLYYDKSTKNTCFIVELPEVATELKKVA